MIVVIANISQATIFTHFINRKKYILSNAWTNNDLGHWLISQQTQSFQSIFRRANVNFYEQIKKHNDNHFHKMYLWTRHIKP